MNKLAIIPFLFMFAVVPSYAQSQTTDESDRFSLVYAHSVLRNPEGQLLVYQENYAVRTANHALFNAFLDHEIENDDAEMSLIDIEGETHEMIKVTTHVTFDTETLRGWDALGANIEGQSYTFAIFFHEGYPVMPGDELTITWTFIRAMV